MVKQSEYANVRAFFWYFHVFSFHIFLDHMRILSSSLEISDSKSTCLPHFVQIFIFLCAFGFFIE